MTYQPSPRPEYDGPAVVRYEQVTRHLWGDAQAGRVADWIYLSNQNLHVLVYGLPVGGSFTHSEEYRTVFGADEVMVVLEGQFALANPETGEVQPAGVSEAIAFRKDTWHHGFNLGQELVRVLEFFSPPPLQGTSGAYARTRPYLPENEWKYLLPQAARHDFPFTQRKAAPRTLIKLRESDLLYELRGADRRILVGYFVSTEHLAAGRITLPAGAHSETEQHAGDEFVYVETGPAFLYLPGAQGERWYELHEKDGFYLPAGTLHEYHNLGSQPARLIFAVAPNEE